MMKRIIAAILVLTFMLPMALPWLSHEALGNLHTQLEAHHYTSESGHGHGHQHIAEATDAEHSAHLDIISFFDNLHVDLKNPQLAKQVALKTQLQDIQFVLAAIHLAGAVISWLPTQGQGPPPYPADVYLASLSVPVYLATQRLRI